MSDNSNDSALQGRVPLVALGGVPAVVLEGVPPDIAVPGGGASVADSFASAVGSAVVLQRRQRRTILELEQDEVVVRKGDRGDPSSKTYVTNRAAATKPLSLKFLGSYHLQSKNADGENVQKNNQYDLRGPLQIPVLYHDIVGEDAADGRWDSFNPDREIVDLTTHWGSVTLDHVLKWQVDFNGYSEAEARISSIWLKEQLTSSMDVELRRQVEELEQELDHYQRGGITYYKLMVDTLFKMSSMAEDSIKQFLKEFGKNGLAKIPNENVRLIAFQINGVAERLADSNLLRSESHIQVVTGYCICSVPAFKQVFNNKLSEYVYQDATGSSPMSAMSSPQVLAKIRSRKLLVLQCLFMTT
jgi:hypothetical protein